MAKYKIVKTERVYYSYYYSQLEYWYEVYKKEWIFWTRQYDLEGYFVNDSYAQKSVMTDIVRRREARKEASRSKEVEFEI